MCCSGLCLSFSQFLFTFSPIDGNDFQELFLSPLDNNNKKQQQQQQHQGLKFQTVISEGHFRFANGNFRHLKRKGYRGKEKKREGGERGEKERERERERERVCVRERERERERERVCV